MNFTPRDIYASHILLPIGSLLRSHNELFNPEEAGGTCMFGCHWDNGGVYRCQKAGERVVVVVVGRTGMCRGRSGKEKIEYTKTGPR